MATIDWVPDDLLSHVLNFFTRAELMVLMPVNRRWRRLVIEHRTYWMHIDLHNHRLSSATPGEMRLFGLRLSRAAPKPTNVTMSCNNPNEALSHIAAHLFHIKQLEITTLLPLAADVLTALCHPAPVLERLCIYFLDGSTACMPVPVPFNLFGFDAPALKFVSLTCVCPQEPMPPGLQHLDHLGVGGRVVPRVPFEIPDVFSACPNLRELSLRDDVSLHPVFWRPEVWANINHLSFSTGVIGRTWHLLGLPVLGVPFIRVQTDEPNMLPVLAEHLHGALSLVFSLLDTDAYGSQFIVSMRSSASPGLTRELLLSIAFPLDRVRVIANDGMWNRVVSIILPLMNWDEYSEFFCALPALEDFILLLYDPPQWDAAPLLTTTLRVSCPHLTRLILRNHWSGDPETVDVKLLAALAAQMFRDAPFPLDLRLGNMRFEGAAEAVAATFRTITSDENVSSTSV